MILNHDRVVRSFVVTYLLALHERRVAPQDRRIIVALLALASLFIPLAHFIAPALYLRGIVPENSWIEELQLALWGVIALTCCFAAARGAKWQHVLLAAWLGVLSVLAALRELDLHTLLNAPNMHILGLTPEAAIRWRPDWWFGEGRNGTEVGLGVRVAWAVLLIFVGTLAAAPFTIARYPWRREARRGAPFVWLLWLAVAFAGAGFLADDVIGRPLRRMGFATDGVEESLELFGQILVLVAVLLLVLKRVNPSSPNPQADQEPATPIMVPFEPVQLKTALKPMKFEPVALIWRSRSLRLWPTRRRYG